MKLEKFLKLIDDENFDPEMEIGLNYNNQFLRNLEIVIESVNTRDLKFQNPPINNVDNYYGGDSHKTKVITII